MVQRLLNSVTIFNYFRSLSEMLTFDPSRYKVNLLEIGSSDTDIPGHIELSVRID